jgi:general secretion pathway protein I
LTLKISVKNRMGKICYSGFTLLEVMFALGLIGIALTVLLTLQSQSLSLANEAKFSTSASFLAQRKMVEIELMDTNDLFSDSGDFGEDFPDYSWELEVKAASIPELDKYADSFKQIDLNIYWGDNREYQYNLRMYRFVP